MSIFACSRCGEHKLEIMKSYAFCWECGHCPTVEDSKEDYSWLSKLKTEKPSPKAKPQMQEAVL